jgi:hypothetical protein
MSCPANTCPGGGHSAPAKNTSAAPRKSSATAAVGRVAGKPVTRLMSADAA